MVDPLITLGFTLLKSLDYTVGLTLTLNKLTKRWGQWITSNYDPLEF